MIQYRLNIDDMKKAGPEDILVAQVEVLPQGKQTHIYLCIHAYTFVPRYFG
jgi:hypothetical protein